MSSQKKTNVIGLNDFKEEQNIEKRKSDRYLVRDFLRLQSSMSTNQSKDVEVIDISTEGCSFKIEVNDSKIKNELKQTNFKVYFGKDTYLLLLLHIKNNRLVVENGKKYIIYGCEVDKEQDSYLAYVKLLDFITEYICQANRSIKGVKVSNL